MRPSGQKNRSPKLPETIPQDGEMDEYMHLLWLNGLYYIRALKQLGIAVIFEKENINSLEEDSELRRNFPQYVRALAEVYGVLNEAVASGERYLGENESSNTCEK